jgi:hypothetical protein
MAIAMLPREYQAGANAHIAAAPALLITTPMTPIASAWRIG